MAINTIVAIQTRLKQIYNSIGPYVQNDNLSSQQMQELQTLYDEQKVLSEDYAKLIKDREERQQSQLQQQPQPQSQQQPQPQSQQQPQPQSQQQPQQQHGNK